MMWNEGTDEPKNLITNDCLNLFNLTIPFYSWYNTFIQLQKLLFPRMPVELESRRIIFHESKERTRLQNSKRRRIDHDSQSINYKYGPVNVVRLIIPISLCMLIVVITINSFHSSTPTGVRSFYSAPYHETSSNTLDLLQDAIINAMLTITITIISTTIFVCLYVYKFYKVIFGWFIFTAFIIFFGIMYFFFLEVLKTFNLPVDIFSAIIFFWNFCITGMVCTLWRAPLRLQQGYLIFISARTANMFITFLPNWTTWVLLIALSIWDIIAVLMPRGPLKKLIETAAEREEPIYPMLVYSTLVYGTMTTTDESQSDEESVKSSHTPTTVHEHDNKSGKSNQQSDAIQTTTTQPPRAKSRRSPKRKRPRKKKSNRSEGFKLGLGDFVFYSVLVGKASSFGNWFTTFACFLAVLIGLCLTLLLLLSFKTALPALPISIVIGILFYIFFGVSVQPLADLLSLKQIFM